MAITLDGTNGIDAPAINAGNIVGQVCFFAMTTAPAGFLKANGAAVSRSVYANLFAAIGTTYGAGDGSTTFNLPDYRGEFPRGLDDGRGVDSGRGIGTAQLDQMQGHTHYLLASQATANVSRPESNRVLANGSNILIADNHAGVELGADRGAGSVPREKNEGTPRVGSETRSRNVAALACIKF